ncbi:hypothetical protein NQ314_018920 [Rhamnusium bicolor]|uniref:alpha-glucosidase n=1 Tax=Rhamnusium bicolor TaxID=1586634 RepID=A0AAV8WQA6_9CUCU|nr:hypothetical protein NQ314_018920 [Rhamnusium bicolor]
MLLGTLITIITIGLFLTVKSDIVKIKELNNNILIGKKFSDEDNWWKTATVYQIYPRSFKDSNNDGIGDLAGIIEKLDYIETLGVDAIWLSPIFKSPQVDQGYDISDFRDIDPDYGTLDDFTTLIEEAHKKSIKVVLDFVPNHTSDQHEWFQKSVNLVDGYEDYYIWADGTMSQNGTRIPPNNWDVLTFWLDTHDLDGARIDAIPHLVEDVNLTDEPLSNDPGYTEIDYEYLDHIYTKDQPETFEIVYDWRTHLDNITNTKQVSTRIFMTEAASSIEEVIKYYGTPDGSKLGAHFSFNFYFLGLDESSTAVDIANDINEWIASKVGKEKIDGLNMLVAFLPGVQITYNGEEIGMENGEVTCEQGQDGSAIKDNCTHYESSSRDYERTPFQWNDSENAGFNSGHKTWLPVSSKYKECNVADQLAKDKSHLKIYIELQKLRANLVDQDQLIIRYPRENDKYLLQITRFNIVSSYNFSNVY